MCAHAHVLWQSCQDGWLFGCIIERHQTNALARLGRMNGHSISTRSYDVSQICSLLWAACNILHVASHTNLSLCRPQVAPLRQAFQVICKIVTFLGIMWLACVWRAESPATKWFAQSLLP